MLHKMIKGSEAGMTDAFRLLREHGWDRMSLRKVIGAH